MTQSGGNTPNDIEHRAKSVSKKVGGGISGWLSGIGSWFAFVHHRRLDLRFPVWPPRRAMVAFCGAAILTIFMLLLVDRSYLDAVQAGTTDGNTFFEIITHIGLSDWILYTSGIVILVFTVITADRFAGSLHRLWHRLFLTAYFVFTTVAFSGLITAGLKIVFGRKRPSFVEGQLPWEAVPFTAGYEFASFPSGHSTTSAALAVALALLFPRFKYWFLGAGLLVAASRSIIGVHFPSDVVAGLAIGAGFTWIYARSFARKRLLFHYLPDGRLALRGEGSGHFHEWPKLLGMGAGK